MHHESSKSIYHSTHKLLAFCSFKQLCAKHFKRRKYLKSNGFTGFRNRGPLPPRKDQIKPRMLVPIPPSASDKATMSASYATTATVGGVGGSYGAQNYTTLSHPMMSPLFRPLVVPAAILSAPTLEGTMFSSTPLPPTMPVFSNTKGIVINTIKSTTIGKKWFSGRVRFLMSNGR